MTIQGLIGAAALAAYWCSLLQGADNTSWKASMLRVAQLQRQRDYQGALETLEIAEKQAAVLGADSLEMAVSLNNLGILCQELGRIADAERYFLRFLSLVKRLPDQTLLELRGAGNLAALYLGANQLGAARRLDLPAIAQRLEQVAPGSSDLASAYVNVGLLEAAEGDPAEASAAFRRALLIWEKTDGHAAVQAAAFSDLGVVLMRLHRNADGLEALNRAVALAENELGTQDPALIPLLENAGGGQALTGNPASAVAHLDHALDIAKKSFGMDHIRTARVMAVYAETLRQLHRKGEAKALEKRARAILAKQGREQSLGGGVVDIRDATAFVGR